MSRKAGKTHKRISRKAHKPSFMRRWWDGVSLERKVGATQVVLRIILLAGILVAAGWGMEWLESHVRSTTSSTRNTPVRLQVGVRPSWMPAELSYRIATSFALDTPSSYDDAELTDAIAAQASLNPWVRKVRSVQKSRDSNGRPLVRVDCEFRKPAAMVAWGKRYFFVDDYGVRLRDRDVPRWTAVIPGRNGRKARQETFIEIADVPINTRRWGIEYVLIELDNRMDPAPPAPGEVWDTEALVGNGLRLTALLKTLNVRKGAPQGFRVDARNYAGRRSTVAPHLAFWAGDSYFKFGRFPEKRFHYNVSVDHKMEVLRNHIARHNGMLAGAPDLDLQLD